MQVMPCFRKYNYVLGIIFLYGLLFLKFPINGSLIGDLDIWFYVWQANDYYQWLFDRANYTQINYPIEDVYKFMDSPWGLSSLFIPLKLILNDDIWIFYFIIVIALSLNAISLKILMERFSVSEWIALPLAFAFNLNNFLISNIENLNLTILFPAIFAAVFLDKGLKENKLSYFIISSLFIFYQQCFSIYLFVFQFILFIPIVLKNHKILLKNLMMWAVCIILLSFPFFIHHNEFPLYLLSEPYKTIIINSNDANSIKLIKDYFRIHPGNIIYPAFQDISNPWRYGAKSAFFGISSYILLAISFVYYYKVKQIRSMLPLLITGLLALLISLGPKYEMLHYEFMNPIGWFNQWLSKTVLFRHLFRAHILVIIISFIIIGIFLSKIKRGSLISVVFSLIFIVENLPFRYPLYHSSEFTTQSKELMEITKKIEPKSNLYFLPSCLIIGNEIEISEENNPYKAEMIYNIWSKHLNLNIANGYMAQLPFSKFENYMYSCNLSEAGLQYLQHKENVDYFVLSKEFIREKSKDNGSMLKQNCKLVLSNQKFEIYDCH